MSNEVKKIGKLTRSMTIDFRAMEGEEQQDRFECAISSETPVERWFGDEVLSHDPKAVDLSRMDGAPLLVNHDMNDQVGVIESARVDKDKVLRGVFRFGRSAKAQEIKQDVMDGIRKNISVGYRVHEYLHDKKSDKFTATRWTPLEVSIVAVPADPNVGIGRAESAEYEVLFRSEETQTSVEETEKTQPQTPEQGNTGVNNMPPEQTTAPAGENVRVGTTQSDAAEIVRMAQSHGYGERAAEWISNGKTANEVAREILDLQRSNPIAQKASELKLTEKEQKRYNLSRGLLAAADIRAGKDTNCFELEISQELENLGVRREKGGILVPYSLRALDSITGGKGAEVKATEMGSFIDLLRNRLVTAQMGATIMSGLSGNISFPRQTAASTASWITENPGSDTSDSDLSLGSIQMSPKTLMAPTSYSRQLLAQSSIDIDNLVRNDLVRINAIATDLAALNGSGQSSQPKGVLNVSGVNLVSIGTNGGAPTYANIVNLFTSIEDSNADIGSMGLVTTPIMKGKLKTTPKFTNTGTPIWGMDDVDGYRAMASKQVPSGLTKGSSSDCIAIIAGVWSELMIGYWGAGFEIIADPYSKKKQGLIELTSFLMVDVALRYPEAFSKIVDARNV